MIDVKYTWDDKTWHEYFVAMKDFARQSIAVGILGVEASEKHPTAKISVGEIAAIQEFGTEHIDARPFMKITMQNKSLVLNTLATAARRVLHKKSSPRQALKRAGEVFANAMRQTLLDGVPPPNAQATVDWKGHGDTLIGLSGALYDAIKYEILGGKK